MAPAARDAGQSGDRAEVFFLAAMLWALIRHRPGALSLLLFIAVACAGMTRSHYVFYRYLMIPLPAMAILAGAMAAGVARFAAARIGHRRAAIASALGLGLLLAPSLIPGPPAQPAAPPNRHPHAGARNHSGAHPARRRDCFYRQPTPYGKPQLHTVRVLPFASPEALKQQSVQYVMSDYLEPLAFYSRGPLPDELAILNSSATLVFDANPLKPGAPIPVFDPADAFYAPLRHIKSMTRPARASGFGSRSEKSALIKALSRTSEG